MKRLMTFASVWALILGLAVPAYAQTNELDNLDNLDTTPTVSKTVVVKERGLPISLTAMMGGTWFKDTFESQTINTNVSLGFEAGVRLNEIVDAPFARHLTLNGIFAYSTYDFFTQTSFNFPNAPTDDLSTMMIGGGITGDYKFHKLRPSFGVGIVNVHTVHTQNTTNNVFFNNQRTFNQIAMVVNGGLEVMVSDSIALGGRFQYYFLSKDSSVNSFSNPINSDMYSAMGTLKVNL
jgi:hypothetical protein